MEIKLIMLLSLVLVVLIAIDFYRKALRNKHKKFLKEKDNLSKISFNKNDIQSDDNESSFPLALSGISEYKALKEGFLVLYYEFDNEVDIKTINGFFRSYSLRFIDGMYKQLSNKDTIFVVFPDNTEQLFKNNSIGSYKRFILTMNYKKVSSLGYDVKVCYEAIMEMLDSLDRQTNGILMNENKVRLTKQDKQIYLNSIL